jgi:hypothetical protein
VGEGGARLAELGARRFDPHLVAVPQGGAKIGFVAHDGKTDAALLDERRVAAFEILEEGFDRLVGEVRVPREEHDARGIYLVESYRPLEDEQLILHPQPITLPGQGCTAPCATP